MPDSTSESLKKLGQAASGRTIRLAYQGRSGARWTYSPKVISSRPDSLEVAMLVPLLVGLLVEIQPNPGEAVPRSAGNPTGIRAQVTGCHCSRDGLFRIQLAYHG